MNTLLVPQRGPRAITLRHGLPFRGRLHTPLAKRGRQRGRVSIRLWIPLTGLLVLLSPFLLLAMTAAALHPRLRAMRAHRLIPALARLISSIGGTSIEVDAPRASIRLRFF